MLLIGRRMNINGTGLFQQDVIYYEDDSNYGNGDHIYNDSNLYHSTDN